MAHFPKKPVYLSWLCFSKQNRESGEHMFSSRIFQTTGHTIPIFIWERVCRTLFIFLEKGGSCPFVVKRGEENHNCVANWYGNPGTQHGKNKNPDCCVAAADKRWIIRPIHKSWVAWGGGSVRDCFISSPPCCKSKVELRNSKLQPSTHHGLAGFFWKKNRMEMG